MPSATHASASESAARTQGPHAARRRFLTAQWKCLVMLNYALDPAVLRPRVPRGTELDEFHGVTYASLVGFLFLDTRLLGVPIPLHRNFEEVNLRFYVRRESAGELRRGVVFIRELVPRRAIAAVARWAYNEPYLALPMRHAIKGCDPRATPLALTAPEAQIAYEWRLGKRWQGLRLTARGESALPTEGSVQQFITEHYWGYTTQRDGGTIEYRVEHPSWRVWHECRGDHDIDIAGLYGAEFVPQLQGPPVSALLADGSAVTVDQPARI